MNTLETCVKCKGPVRKQLMFKGKGKKKSQVYFTCISRLCGHVEVKHV